MSKPCLYDGCPIVRWGGGYCKYHQHERKDEKYLKAQQKQKDKYIERIKNSKLTPEHITKTLKPFMTKGATEGWPKDFLDKQRKKYSFKPKLKEATGEKELFEEIWNTRKRVSWLTGADLSEYDCFVKKRSLDPSEVITSTKHPLWHWLFHHVLNKKNYSRYRLEEKNIILLTPQEHTDIHSLSRDKLEKKYGKENMERYWKLFENLKSEYNGTK